VKTGNNVKSDTGVFRKAAQSLVRPRALILGGRLYGAQILVLRFQLNTICTCSLTRYVQRYPEFENYLAICAHAPDCIVRHYDVQCDSQCCRTTARAVIWSTSYFPNVSIFLLTALGGLPENPGIHRQWFQTWLVSAMPVPSRRLHVHQREASSYLLVVGFGDSL